MREKSFAAFILALFLVFFFYDVVFLEKTLSTSSLLPGATPAGPYGFSGHRPPVPFSFDAAGNAWVNEPNPYIITNILHEGGSPLWSPYEGMGTPLVGNLNTEVFNPLKLFLNLSPGPFSQDLFFLLRLLVMGLFTYLFLRERGLSPLPCLLGALCFMLSGYSVYWINLHPLSTVMYLPAVFYFYERWGNRKKLLSAFFMALFLSFAFTAGKIPDVVMGLLLLFLYAIGKGMMRGSALGLCGEGGKVIVASVSGAMMAAFALLPFLELYSCASPLAKAIRTGAACHTIPLFTSVSLFQPLFLGWGNYFYTSWLRWTPPLMLPHAAIVIMLLTMYAGLTRKLLTENAPFFVFSACMVFLVFGIFPSHLVSGMPVFGSIEFLKYNAMLYFSLAVVSASALNHLLHEEKHGTRLYLSITGISAIILAYFFRLHGQIPPEMKGYLTAVLLISLSGIAAIGLAFRFLRSRRIFGGLIFVLLSLELFFYMPKDHPERTGPYRKPPYSDAMKEKSPYRIIGEGNAIPPLVSSALGLYDIRGISVLLPGDYYTFFEHLVSFSVPQTNNPNALFSATSPFIDLIGVKYVLSLQPLDPEKLDEAVRNHLMSLRWIRFFDAMIRHTIQGGATYGFFDTAGAQRFSFFFPKKFTFKTTLRATEPFLFAGFAMKDVSKKGPAKVRIAVQNTVTEVIIKDGGGWTDRWLDISPYAGNVIVVTVESDEGGDGTIVLGNFGLTPGQEKEDAIYKNLLSLHKRELDPLKYKGTYEGLHLYENSNSMERAFVVHKAKRAGDLDEVIRELEEGSNFREVGLVPPSVLQLCKGKSEGGVCPLGEAQEGDHVVIKKYAPDEIAIEAESKGGILVLSDLYYPGWKVRVNGKEEDIVKVFGALRGVPVKSGKSVVLFTYRPVSFYAGLLTAAATFAVWLWYLYRRRDRNNFQKI